MQSGAEVKKSSKSTFTMLPSSEAVSITVPSVAYKSFSITMKSFDTAIPVAMWYPMKNNIKEEDVSYSPAKYKHSISIPRIGQLLANINFLPSFLEKGFILNPTLNNSGEVKVVDGTNIAFPSCKNVIPVIILAHGYLGSRFDLSHLAESLADQGFICISPECPESLAASYPRTEGLDRTKIISEILNGPVLNELISSSPKNTKVKFGIIGHSLGCGTATNTGDKAWTRVCIAGYPGEREDTVGGDMLFISSINDGTVTLSRLEGAIPRDFVRMNEKDERVISSSKSSIPRRTAIIFESDTGPNHISFLADGVNNAMIDLLSPLLPVAQAIGIPVLDFDKYQVSQDSKPTADVVIPLVSSYLRQRMLG